MSEKEKDPVQSGVLTTTMEGVEAVSKEEIDKILKQVDKEASARKLTGTPHWIVYVIGVSWSIFQVYTAAFGLAPCPAAAIHPPGVCLRIDLPAVPGPRRRRGQSPVLVQLGDSHFCLLYRVVHGLKLHAHHGGRRGLFPHGLYRRRLRHPAHAGGGATGGGAADRLPGDVFSALLLFRGLFPRFHVAPRVFAGAHRLPHVSDHRGHPGYSVRGGGDVHLPVHPVRLVP